MLRRSLYRWMLTSELIQVRVGGGFMCLMHYAWPRWICTEIEASRQLPAEWVGTLKYIHNRDFMFGKLETVKQ